MTSVPKSMSGIIIEANGGTEVLQWKEDIPVPALKEGEILVRNEVTGVNFIDTYFRSGLYKAPSFPHIVGGEAAGVVAAVHDSVTRIKPGDKVAYLHTKGAYAQYNAVPAAKSVVLPDSISSDVGASAILQGLTALTFIREAHHVQPGQWVLIHAAAGGVGSLLVQMCHAVGAKVIGAVGSPEKGDIAKSLGADYIINSRTENLVARVKDITGGHGADVIFDGVGKATFDSDLENIARKGTICVFGNASGPVPPVDVLKLGGTKNIKLCRPVVFAYVATQEEFDGYSKELFDWIATGKIKCAVSKKYSLKDAAQAHQDLEGRKSTGKLVLEVP